MKDGEKLMTNYLTLYENAVVSTALISFDMKSLTMYMPTISGSLTELNIHIEKTCLIFHRTIRNRYDLLQIRYNSGQINTCLCITSRMSTFFIYIERHYLSLKFHTVYLRTVIAHKRGCRQFAVLNTGLRSTIIPQAHWVICDHHPTRICGATSVPSEKFKVSIWTRNSWSDDARINE